MGDAVALHGWIQLLNGSPAANAHEATSVFCKALVEVEAAADKSTTPWAQRVSIAASKGDETALLGLAREARASGQNPSAAMESYFEARAGGTRGFDYDSGLPQSRGRDLQPGTAIPHEKWHRPPGPKDASAAWEHISDLSR